MVIICQNINDLFLVGAALEIGDKSEVVFESDNLPAVLTKAGGGDRTWA